MKTKILPRRLMFVMLQCLVLATSQAQSLCSQAFAYAGTNQTFTVPSGVHQITVKLWGGGGAGGNYVFNDIGGGGGFATATLNVNPGEQYIIIVGGAGLTGAGPGAYGGGGAKDCGAGGRGGGRSAIRNAADIELITAGAGGGGGGVAQDFETGGHGGGGLSGEPDNWLPYGGGAGTQTEGGIGGHRKPDDPNPNAGGGEAGGLFFGGKANCLDNGYNGSGGGGYYGGGSGTDYGDGAGGAGSSFIPDGGTTIAVSGNVPGNISDPDYADNAGYGGTKATVGNAGRVVILWSTNNNLFYLDTDADGYGDINNSVQDCIQPAGYVADSTDCDDNDAATHPGATEICDGKDNDCNGLIDDITYYRDADGDSYGDANNNLQTCIQPEGYVRDNSDCDDNDASVYPGATEICDGKDNDCNGLIDDITYYRDADGDSYGDANDTLQTCIQPEGYVRDNSDCDDNNASVYPGATEICDGIDNNCNGQTDEGFDTDGDGYSLCAGDCDDNDATVYPGAAEICDGKDNDCNGLIDDGIQTTYYRDADGDGYGDINNSVQNCSQPGGYVTDSGDCDDNDATVYPGATEICDGKDNDCNGLIDDGIQTTYYRDADGDGYGNNSNSIQNCAQPPGYVTDNTDCDDNDASISSPPEICDGIDNNCNGLIDEGLTTTYYRDADGDGWGDRNNSVQSCSQPPGYLTHEKDCNDNDATVYPGAPEICDGKDNDCNGKVDDGAKDVAYFSDADGDGYGGTRGKLLKLHCGVLPPAGFVLSNNDCNDNDASIHPGAIEICDGKDNNCDGQIDEGFDADGDGYTSCDGDCNDNDATIYPGAPEICDGKDNDCNGLIDDGLPLATYYRDTDNDGYGDINKSVQNCSQPSGYVTDHSDCNDNDASIHPGALEICDGKDNNCDGLIDNNIVYYRDADGDGYGNISSPKKVCVQPAGYVRDSTDCKDNNANINPGKTEICGNNIDDNCNGQIDEGCSLISVSPQPASVNEGNKGSSNMTFVVSLSAPAVKNSQVNYQTVDVTATAGTDYVTKTGALSFSIGQSSKTVVVKITGDINPEADETFNLVLSNPVNIVISQGSATGTIINDDGLAFTKQPMYNNKISNPKDSDQVSVCSRLTIPTLLQKNQIWNIQGLPLLNTIILFNANGQTVFQANNYKNNNSLSNLIPGVYFYEIVLRNQEGRIESCRGKMTIVSY